MDLMALHTAAVGMTSVQWRDLWLRAAGGEQVGIDLPPFPPEKVQKITNNVSGVETMRGAAEFYRIADEEMAKRFPDNVANLKLLDFGAGWGRITCGPCNAINEGAWQNGSKAHSRIGMIAKDLE